jgi:hypothetical protein
MRRSSAALLALLIAAPLVPATLSAPAQAQGRGHDDRDDRRDRRDYRDSGDWQWRERERRAEEWRRRHDAPRYVYSPPVIYTPPPVYYAPPAPVYAPRYVEPGFGLNLIVPLNIR